MMVVHAACSFRDYMFGDPMQGCFWTVKPSMQDNLLICVEKCVMQGRPMVAREI